jgi:hypothetical protein
MMQRTFSFNIATLIKDIISLFVEKEKEPILPTFNRTSPVFEVPLDAIIVTPEPSPKIEF